MPKKGRQATRMTPGFTGPFKGEPQQGTLFDKRVVNVQNPELAAQQPGPRGYSLHRSRQFQDVVQRPELEYRAEKPGEYAEAMQGGYHAGRVPSVAPEEHPYGPAWLGSKYNGPMSQEEMDRLEAKDPHVFSPKQQVEKSMGRARSKMVDTLARSTVNPAHLHNLSTVVIRPQSTTVAGQYHPSAKAISLNVTGSSQSYAAKYRGEEMYDPEAEMHPERVKQPRQRGPIDPDSELTLLHELGHHVSHEAGTWHSRYVEPTERAGEEGYADRFAMEHWRRDPRHTAWEGHFDPRQHTYLGRGSELTTFPEYGRSLGRENRPPVERTTVTPAMEARDRPMLGHGTGVFDVAIPEKIRKGFNPSYGMHEYPSDATEAEGAWYGKKRQMTNAEIFHVGNEPDTPDRWNVRRQSLGRQFHE